MTWRWGRMGEREMIGGRRDGRKSGNGWRGKRREKEWNNVSKREITGERKGERMKTLEGSDWKEERRESGGESGETKKLLEREETGERKYEREIME